MAQQQPPQTAPRRLGDRNLAVRVASVVVLLPLVLWLVHLGGLPFASLAALACGLGALEMGAMALPGERLLVMPAVIAAAALPLLLATPAEENLHGLWTAATLLTLTLRLLRPGPLEGAGIQVSQAVFSGLYGSLLGYLVALRALGPASSWAGAGWVILTMAVTWGGDTGAYFGGRLMGRRKMIPRVSPAKTWEGLFTGIATSVGAALLVRHSLLPSLPLVHTLVIGLLGGLGGPIGDLLESMLKRAYGVKDSGRIIPGHGGILDRVDALLVTAPLILSYARHFHLATP